MAGHARYSATAKAASGEPTRPVLEMTFRGHRRDVCCAAFQPSDPWAATPTLTATATESTAGVMPPRLITGGADGAVMLWDARPTCRAIRFTGHCGPVLGCDCATRCTGAASVTLLASCGADGYARLWVPNLRRTSTTYPSTRVIHAPPSSSANGDQRNGGGVGGDSLGTMWRAHTGAARVIKFAQDGSSHLYTAGDDKSIKVWDMSYSATGSHHVGGRPLATFRSTRFLGNFNGAGRPAMSVAGTRDVTLPGSHTNWVRCLAVQRPTLGGSFGHYVASGGDDCAVLVWDTRSPHAGPAHAFSQHRAAVRGVSFHNNGFQLASCDVSGAINVYDLRRSSSPATGGATRYGLVQHYADAHGSGGVAVNDVCFAPSGGWLLSAGDDGTAKLWDTVEGFLYCTAQAHEGPVRTARFSDDGSFFVTAAVDGVAMIWRAGLPRVPSAPPRRPVAAAHAAHNYQLDGDEAMVDGRGYGDKDEGVGVGVREPYAMAASDHHRRRAPMAEKPKRVATRAHAGPHTPSSTTTQGAEDPSYAAWQRRIVHTDPTLATTAPSPAGIPPTERTNVVAPPLAAAASPASSTTTEGEGEGEARSPHPPASACHPSNRPPRAPAAASSPSNDANGSTATTRHRSLERCVECYSHIPSPQKEAELRKKLTGQQSGGEGSMRPTDGDGYEADANSALDRQHQQRQQQKPPRPSSSLADRRLENVENAVAALMDYVQEENAHRDQELERLRKDVDRQSARQREEIGVLKTLMEELLAQQAILLKKAMRADGSDGGSPRAASEKEKTTDESAVGAAGEEGPPVE